MKNTKHRLEIFSFFDHTGISRHLEKMAEKGWMLEKITNTGWVYRRIEPKKIHFAVSYYPKASQFDPEPSEEQKLLHDFCAHTGWHLACTSAQMQIFYNEFENPTPIETEPELELQAIHASAKKGFLRSYITVLVLALMCAAFLIYYFLTDPLDFLSTQTKWDTGFAFLLLTVFASVELICYFRWYYRARIAARQGVFLKVPNTSLFQASMLGLMVILMMFTLYSHIVCHSGIQQWIPVLAILFTFVLFVIANGTRNYGIQNKFSSNRNRIRTTFTTCLVSCTLMMFLNYVIDYASSHAWFIGNDLETYRYAEKTWVVYQDELPLVVEDLIDVDYDNYIKERQGNTSPVLGHLSMRQYPRLNEENYHTIPQLHYTLTHVKFPALYEFCKNRLIYEAEVLPARVHWKYRFENSAPWGAQEAYRMYDLEEGITNRYLLCYENLLVTIKFDWEPTAEQMAIVGEKLSRNYTKERNP